MATKTPSKPASTAKTLELGSVAIASGGSRGEAAPSGAAHLVDGWQPVCGGERVRFIFPGRTLNVDTDCPACAAKIAQPARRAPRSIGD